ncbi:hypothetical protein [Lonepinella sp. BR2930]|uniref:hypothetical protein n=1 Tax=Lonepinella sp. BR2930 TaxID=3434554 RepID=UPI003F6DE06E
MKYPKGLALIRKNDFNYIFELFLNDTYNSLTPTCRLLDFCQYIRFLNTENKQQFLRYAVGRLIHLPDDPAKKIKTGDLEELICYLSNERDIFYQYPDDYELNEPYRKSSLKSLIAKIKAKPEMNKFKDVRYRYEIK